MVSAVTRRIDMPDELTPEVARGEIEKLRSSEEVKNVMHPSHERALQSLAEMYAKAHPEPAEEQPQPAETPSETPPKAEEPTEEDPFGVPPAELAAMDGLRAEWGEDYDLYLSQAQGLAAEYAKTFGNEFVEWLETSRAGSHPLIIKSFQAWANGLQGPDVSPSEARELVKVLRAGEYYGRGNSKMHDVLKDVVGRLYEIGYEG
jgi:hypothetical protein